MQSLRYLRNASWLRLHALVYAQKKRLQQPLNKLDCLLLLLLNEEYTRHPFYGSRRMTNYLHGQGHAVNRKRVQRLMQTLDSAGMALAPIPASRSIRFLSVPAQRRRYQPA